MTKALVRGLAVLGFSDVVEMRAETAILMLKEVHSWK